MSAEHWRRNMQIRYEWIRPNLLVEWNVSLQFHTWMFLALHFLANEILKLVFRTFWYKLHVLFKERFSLEHNFLNPIFRSYPNTTEVDNCFVNLVRYRRIGYYNFLAHQFTIAIKSLFEVLTLIFEFEIQSDIFCLKYRVLEIQRC